jgi:hypothetical protein
LLLCSGGDALPEVFQKGKSSVQTLWRTTLVRYQAQALDHTRQHFALLAFEVVYRLGALAGMHRIVEFLFETHWICTLPGGQNLLGVLRYVHRIKSPWGLYRKSALFFEDIPR